jgi:uncharacterized membrane protein YeiH
MLHILEHLSVAGCAISGVLAARGKQIDLFGVIVLALVTAFGGGTVRDITLGDLPVFWTRDPAFLLNAVVVAIATFYIARRRHFPLTALLVADALALALFAVIGAQKALAMQMAPSVAITMGIITGVAGGIIRDLLTGDIPVVFRKETHFYATAAFCGCAVYVLLASFCPTDSQRNVVTGVAITLLLRLASIRWKVTLPVFEPVET